MATPRGGHGDGGTAARARPRILLVEDQMLVALYLEDLLVDLGCAVLGPAGSVTDALAVTRREPVDGAVLDINLRGEPSFPVARELRVRPVPFFFVTGYESAILPLDLRDVPCLTKPVSEPAFATLVRGLFSGAA